MKTTYHCHAQTLHATRNGVTASCPLPICETDARGWLELLRAAIRLLNDKLYVAEHKRERSECL